uniref:Secreted protein n=2 Tax=Moniliophthora roreri TaxID=221103 RepID=A0A0W0ETP8_MONRR
MTALLRSLLALALPAFTLAQNIISKGTFASPKTGVKWRYWIQDASADLDVLRSDVAEMAKVGSSGFELLSYQSYGSVIGPVILDPTDVAFGSDRFVNVTATLVQAAKQHNLTIDFTLGPNQGAGVPVKPDEVDQEGMLTELVFGSRFLQSGESFDGPLPAPTIVPCIPVLGGASEICTAHTTQKYLVGIIGARLAEGANISSHRVSLDFSTVVDLTDEVRGSGNMSAISWTPIGNGTSVLLAFYYRRNGYPEAVGGFNGAQDDKPGSWGSFVIDHLSPKGVNISSSFIQRNVLSRADIGEMLSEPGVGKYMWEDSMEFLTQVLWTDTFSQRFEERHGYRVGRVLPVLHGLVPGSPAFNTAPFLNQTFDYGTSSNSYAFVEDYRDTLSSLYRDYIAAFNEWAHSIGLQYSNQPAYNFQIDVAASAAIPDVPEIESLGLPNIDEARQLSGGVHLGNRSIFSSETAARPGLAVSIPMSKLLEDSKLQFAGHVNLIMLHGYAYSGPYPGTTWPGFCTFAYLFADMHGPKMPGWTHYKGYLDFLARNQYILQSGVPKVDVALYRKGYDTVKDQSLFPSTSLIEAGYTYEYVSPENFNLPGVVVEDGRLALGGPAYKALVLNRVQNITIDGAQHLIDFANDGLPVVIAGGIPNGIPGFDADGTKSSQAQALMQQLTTLPTVKVVQDEDAVPGALSSLGVRPVAGIEPSVSTLYTVRRDEASNAGITSHFFFFNQANNSIDGTLTLNIGFQGLPYTLDAWSGTVSPIFIWDSPSPEIISIPGFSLAANETALITITSESEFEGVSSPVVHVSNADSEVFAGASTRGSIELRSTTEGSKKVTFSTGDTQTIKFSLEGETVRELTGWQLNITKWTPPEDLSQIPSVLVPEPAINLTQGLIPWDQLEGHKNTSGLGTYITTFEWSHAIDSNVGVQLDFGVVVHTLKAWLNGIELPTADPTHPVVDISNLVQEGSNTLRVDAASTLLNVVNSVPGITSLGVPRFSIFQRNQQYGLVVPVRLIPYSRVTMEQGL